MIYTTFHRLTVKAPRPDAREGWNFPYQGDDWPDECGWYIVLREEVRGDKHWQEVKQIVDYCLWLEDKEEFAGCRDSVLAWRKFTKRDHEAALKKANEWHSEVSRTEWEHQWFGCVPMPWK